MRISGRSPGGALALTSGDRAIATHVEALVGVLGGGDHDASTIERALARHHGDPIARALTAHEETFTATIDPSGVETLLQAIYLTMSAPRRDDDALAAGIAKRRDYERQEAEPPLEYQLPTDLALELGVDTAIAGATPEQVWRIYGDRFTDASGLRIEIRGAVDLAALRPLVARWLGVLPASRAEPVVPAVRPRERIALNRSHAHDPQYCALTVMWIGGTTDDDALTLLVGALRLLPGDADGATIPSSPPGHRVRFFGHWNCLHGPPLDEARLRRHLTRVASGRLTADELEELRDWLVREPRWSDGAAAAITAARVAAAVRRLMPPRSLVVLTTRPRP